jgi:serine/threonine protein kinase/tetratricopeptide (TPR) repeat protein
MVGQTISHYRILEKLGEGGMGVVYRAEDTKLKRTVALKFLPRGLEAHEPERARFLQEAQAAAALNHPNICTIHDIAGEGDPKGAGQQFIVMEYVDGQTMSRKAVGADHRSALKVNEAITYAIQIGEALQEAHSKGIVHRDIKTDNIMVNAKNQVKVMDFGLAKLKGSLKLTKTSSTVGTLAYMAPEQIQGEQVDARSDIFSFGVVLYEMLTGHMPFRGEHEAAMMYSILNEEPESLNKYLPDVPSELLHVLNRALEKDPEERYQTVHDMLIDLRRLKKETTRVVRPVVQVEPSEGLLEKLAKPSEGLLRKKWMRPSATAAGGLVVLAIFYFLIWPLIHGLLFRAERIPIAVISFENQTGDPQFDYLRTAIPNLLTTSLEQSTALRVTTWERMRDLLKQMGKADVQVINTDLGFELCRKDSVKALVTGSFVKMGDMFATDVKVLDVESKALLKSASSKGEGVGSILKVQIDELGKQIATGIGLPESKVAKEQKAIAEVTTSSLEAYNFYLRGMQEYEKMYYGDARRFLEKAISLDSTFAMAYLYLARSCTWLGDQQSTRAAYDRAFKFSDKVTRKEKLFIDAAYADAIEGNRDRQYQILKRLESEFPREKEVHYRLYFLGGEEAIPHLQQAIALDPTWGQAVNQLAYEYAFKGDYESALRWLRQYASISPGDANPYDSMGEMYFLMGKLDESIANYKQALEIKPDFNSNFQIAYIHALAENYTETLKWIEKRPLENRPFIAQYRQRFLQCFFAWWLGRNSEASTKISAASELFKKSANRTFEGGIEGLRAVVLADRGQFERARNALTAAAKLMSAAYSEHSGLFEVFARLLELQRAKLYLREGQRQPVENMLAEATPMPEKVIEALKSWLPFGLHQLRGELFLAQGRLDEAIKHLKNPPALPTPAMTFPEFMGAYNIYFARDGLASAYVQKGDLDSAIAEYERITTFDPSSKDRRLIRPLHRYELAKLYERKGLKEKAIAQYQRFLTLWKNADPDRPEPKDARARLARLKRKNLG